ncbi:MAG: hypothetical protein F6K44_20360, partial [Moorea sp. SIO3E2]|nr:hypothetical protein [Moorena sp. SIO3E2]
MGRWGDRKHFYSFSDIYQVNSMFLARFPIPDSRFPIPDSQLPIPDSIPIVITQLLLSLLVSGQTPDLCVGSVQSCIH